jgi:hypothetical protein
VPLLAGTPSKCGLICYSVASTEVAGARRPQARKLGARRSVNRQPEEAVRLHLCLRRLHGDARRISKSVTDGRSPSPLPASVPLGEDASSSMEPYGTRHSRAKCARARSHRLRTPGDRLINAHVVLTASIRLRTFGAVADLRLW